MKTASVEEGDRRGIITYAKGVTETKPVPPDHTSRRFIYDHITIHTSMIVIEQQVGKRWRPLLRWFMGKHIMEMKHENEKRSRASSNLRSKKEGSKVAGSGSHGRSSRDGSSAVCGPKVADRVARARRKGKAKAGAGGKAGAGADAGKDPR